MLMEDVKDEQSSSSRLYRPPEVAVTEVLVEAGYAGSGTGGETPDWEHEPGYWQ